MRRLARWVRTLACVLGIGWTVSWVQDDDEGDVWAFAICPCGDQWTNRAGWWGIVR